MLAPEVPLEELPRYPLAFFREDHGPGLALGVVDEPFLVKPVHAAPVEAFPGSNNRPVPERSKVEEGQHHLVDLFLVVLHLSGQSLSRFPSPGGRE